MPAVTITCHTGHGILPYLEAAAQLRITVFRDYPYLYDGDLTYERDYLHTYATAPDSLFVLARAGPTVIGLSTGVPLTRETAEVQAPFLAAGIPIPSVFYFGESVLLPAYRGRGIGVTFMAERERYARTIPGISLAAFCAVDRPLDHPARPTDYTPLHTFWQKRGFTQTTLHTTFTWKELHQPTPTAKQLTFWTKPLS